MKKPNLKMQPLTTEQKSQVCGAGFNWIAFWGLSILSSVVIRSFFADKATVGINTVGRASWEEGKTNSIKTKSETTEFQTMLTLLKKLYDF